MEHSKLTITLLAATLITLTGCASVTGNVYKQKSGEYKASYSAKTEREAMKVVHEDAKITCKKDGGKTPAIVNEEITKLTEETEKSGEGFSAVAGSAVTALDKYFGSENVRATLIFDCM